MGLTEEISPLNKCLKKLFLPAKLNVPSDYGDLGNALQTLVFLFINRQCPSAKGIVSFDSLATKSFVARFQRDAYGLSNYEGLLNKLKKEDKIHESAHTTLVSSLCTIGVRINSRNPRKTRVAAAFSLWFSALKPMRLTGMCAEGISEKQLMTLGGMCNFWIACQFLKVFGDLEFGTGEDRKERLDRIPYDFTVRDLNLSSLEMLYCSVLRTDATLAERERKFDAQ